MIGNLKSFRIVHKTTVLGLVKSAELLSYRGQKITAASGSSNKEINEYYRLIQSQVESAVMPRNILFPHRERSIMCIRGQCKILAIHEVWT